ncbi:aldose 1-epimerase family protein [Olivibacter ginsenosidimutans]|uniref:Aldose 1-epimerase family protein n=1 Tax=Olivibacter ginsenosidimutans TaxID=1176537 RepID=A0ABP9BIF9_9SPHI
MIALNNEYITIHIKKKGAELCSLYNKTLALEYMWQADPSYWPWHAPNLFPIVGGLVNNEISIEGSLYQLQRHGFARQSNFTVIESSGKHAILSLRYTKETLAAYPYHFEYQVLYHLHDESLTCTYKVINLDNRTIWFSLGAHPAFNIPFFAHERYDDYYIEFSKEESLIRHHLSPAGFFTGEPSPVFLQGKKLRLAETLFNEDALVFKTIDSKALYIRSKNHPHSLKISYPEFKSLGIWAKPGAPFVCIEPWLGYADNEQPKGSIKEKEGIISLSSGHVFEANYTITIQ